MRVNVYSQELTNGIELIEQRASTGVTYSAVRIYLLSAQELHDRDGDDDRSAVTFWLPRSRRRRELLADTFRRMADAVLQAEPETGLDE